MKVNVPEKARRRPGEIGLCKLLISHRSWFFVSLQILLCLVFPFLVHSMIKFSTEDDVADSPSSSNEVAPHNAAGGASNSEGRGGGGAGGGGGGGDGIDVDWHKKKQKRRRKLGRISFFKALYYFETAPIVKFFYHSVSIKMDDILS